MKGKFIISVIAIIVLSVMVVVLYDSDPMTVSNDLEENPYDWVVSYTTAEEPLVEQKVESVLESNYDGFLTEEDIYKLQLWVSGNIQYMSGEPQYPKDTLTTFKGNCYNKGILLYSMFLHESRNETQKPIYMLLIDIGETFKHTAVCTKLGSNIIISDTTIDSWAINDICKLSDPQIAIENIIDGTTVTEYRIITAVSLNDYKEFEDNEEFYDWI